jgi:hypothetical protein
MDRRFYVVTRRIFGAGAVLGIFALVSPSMAEKSATFAKDIAPIFQAKCQNCHRKDSMAPMSLVTYEETRPWAKSIKERVITRNIGISIRRWESGISRMTCH